MSDDLSPLDEAFSDPVRAKEMYFHRCALAHEREDELRQRLERAEEALREILRHTGAPNAWHDGDGCQLRADGHDNCRPVIFAIAREALAAGEENGR